jgi:antitoxin component of MazEF toxin-antitoxin module
MITTNITKVGGSLYVLLPSDLAELYEIEKGEAVDIDIREGGIFIILRKKDNAVHKQN